MNMNRIQIAIGLIALGVALPPLFTSCCPSVPDTPNTTVYPGSVSQYYKESWNGHVYVLKQWGQQGGITHDPDCPCHKEAKKEEHVYENPNQN